MAEATRAVTELVVDGRQAVAGASAVETAYERAGISVDKLQAKIDAGVAAQMRLAATGPQSVDRVTAAYQKLQASMDPVARAQFAAEREITRSMALINRAVVLGVTTEMEAAATISRLRQKQIAEINAVRDAQIAANRVVANDNDVMAGGRRQILGYQAFDIGQGLAAGTPLAIIAAQQGPQIAQLYAAQGGLNALWKDAVGILGSVARAAGPWIAALAAMYGAYRLISSFTAEAAIGVDAATQALADQAAPIGTVQAGITELAQLQKTYQDAIRSTGDVSTAATDKIIANTKREFEAKKALLELESVRQEAALRANEAEIARQGLELRGGLTSFNVRTDLERQGFSDPRINGGVPFVRLPGDISGIDRLQEIIEKSPVFLKLRELRAEGELTRLTFENLQEALKATFNDGSLIKDKNLIDPVSGRPLSNLPVPSFRGVDDQPGSLSFFNDTVRSGALRIQQLQQERVALGLTGAELEAYRFAQQTVNEALAKNIELSPEQVAALKEQAIAYGELSEQIAKAKLQRDIAFERDQLGRSALDQTIASRLQSAGLPVDLNSEEANALRMLETLRRVRDAWEDIRDVGRSAIDGIVDSAIDGFDNIEDLVADIGKSILKEFLTISLANPLKNALYGDNLPTLDSIGGIGGFFKALIGGAAPGTDKAVGAMNVNAGTVIVNGGVAGGTGGLVDRIFNPANGNDPWGGGLRNAGTFGPPRSLSGIGSPGSAPLAQLGANGLVPVDEVAAYIQQAAIARGIDPAIALRVARSEGLGEGIWQSAVMRNGLRETSYGPFQLLTGGGLGDKFERLTGMRASDPAGVFKQVDFALDEAAKGGWSPWYGAAKVGVSPWEGLSGAKALGIGDLAATTKEATRALDVMATKSIDASQGLGGLGDIASNLGGASGGGGGLFSWIGKLFGGVNWGTSLDDLTWDTWANGGAFHRGNVIPFANGGIVNRPTLFPMANGAGLMGEAGEEGILPLRRNSRGQLGVIAGGQQAPAQVINFQSIVNNNSSAKVETREEDDGFGGRRIVHTISDEVTDAMNRRGTSLNREMNRRGARPKGALR